jgi:hypothetical protein
VIVPAHCASSALMESPIVEAMIACVLEARRGGDAARKP